MKPSLIRLRARIVLAVALAAVAGCGGDSNGDLGSATAPGIVVGAPAPQAAAASCAGADLSGLKSMVYVSSQGADSAGCGITTAVACKTIQQGIANCGAAGCGVLVRHGLYPTTATIALRNGVNVYGGCRFDGEPDRKYRSVIQASPAPGAPALSANTIDSPTLVSGLVVLGKDESANGTASIAMAVRSSKGLTLARVTLAAGSAGPGAAGGTAAAGPGVDGSKGAHITGGSGGAGGPSCASNPSAAGTGGQGGDGETGDTHICVGTCACLYTNWTEAYGRDGAASGSARGGSGGKPATGGEFCSGPSFGDDFTGKSGDPGSSGACSTRPGLPSGDSWGTLSGVAWSPGAGGAGGTGDVGSGGGGGGSGGMCVGFPDGIHAQFISGSPGGGAGGGGCGGPGGAGGQQGGASIALIASNSLIAGLSSVSIVPARGGIGGAGGKGAVGGVGGKGRPGYPGGPITVGASSCPGPSGSGGNGGPGGAGSGGAGGNGGPSIGIALVDGSTPAGEAGVYPALASAGGPGGPGGQGGAGNCSGATGAAGIAGGAKPVVDFDQPLASVLPAGPPLAQNQSIGSRIGSGELRMQPDGNPISWRRR